MARLFTPAADSMIRLGMATLAALPVGLIVTLLIVARSAIGNGVHASIEQPVQFDHRHHVNDDGIDCRYCHNAVTKGATAGIPPTSLCMGCHSQVWNSSPKLKPVRDSYFSNAPIPWNKVNRIPDFVYFNHSIHISKGVGCVTCHGRVDQMPNVEQVSTLAMGWCLDCHRNPAPHLRPPEAVTQMDWKPGQPNELVALNDAQVHPRTECTTCHR